MDQFLLFTVGPLLLSVKGIIDLAQMPPTILLPHPGGTGTPTLERMAYLPGAQPPFPPRAFNPTSISPGEDPSLPNPFTHYLPCHDLGVPSHLCKSAALHWPEVSKVSSACPVTDEVESSCSHTCRNFSRNCLTVAKPQGDVLPKESVFKLIILWAQKVLLWNVKCSVYHLIFEWSSLLICFYVCSWNCDVAIHLNSTFL